MYLFGTSLTLTLLRAPSREFGLAEGAWPGWRLWPLSLCLVQGLWSVGEDTAVLFCELFHFVAWQVFKNGASKTDKMAKRDKAAEQLNDFLKAHKVSFTPSLNSSWHKYTIILNEWILKTSIILAPVSSAQPDSRPLAIPCPSSVTPLTLPVDNQGAEWKIPERTGDVKEMCFQFLFEEGSWNLVLQ